MCGRKTIPRIIQTQFFLGNFVGVLLSGVVADRYGRKFCYCLFLTLWIIFGVTGSFTPNLYVWVLLRFLCGAMSLGYNNALSVYVTESTHGKWRAYLGNTMGEFFWNSGHMTLGGLVYVVRDMTNLELIIGLSATPFLIMWFIMPESPRWLLAKGKKEKAKRVITRACLLNRKSIKPVEDFVDSFKTVDNIKKGSTVDLFRTPCIRRNTILMCLTWLSFSMGYFGLIYNTPSLNWNIFLVFVFPPIIVAVIMPIEPFMQNILGRNGNQ